jgi:dUTP pyrophosphatase
VFIKIKKLHKDAVIPAYKTDGAGAFDIHSLGEGVLHPGDTYTFCTGLAFEIPPGFALMIYSRSGHGFGPEVKLVNGTGIIDSDYRGEVMIKLERFRNRISTSDDAPFKVSVGDRIAQGIILPVPRVSFIETEELSETVRGTGGFGSTGA